jgi:hypothetical protein
MVPFHLFLFLFSFFTKKSEKEMTFDQYQHRLLVEQLREKSKDMRSNMNHFM